MMNNNARQSAMDKTLEDSFPASDPPSWSSPRHEGNQEKEPEPQKNKVKNRPDESRQHFSKQDYLADGNRIGARH